MATDSDVNGGQAPEAPRVRFGPRPDDTIPASWAEAMLMDWRRTSQSGFGRALQRAALGTDD